MCQTLTQTRVGGGGGTKGSDIDDTRVLVLKGCQHDKRGYCALHGMLAVKKWRQISCLKAGPGGSKVKTVRRKHYFECEVGPRGQGVMRQTLLSFSRTPTLATRTGGGHDGVGGGLDNNFSSTTVEQPGEAAQSVGLE